MDFSWLSNRFFKVGKMNKNLKILVFEIFFEESSQENPRTIRFSLFSLLIYSLLGLWFIRHIASHHIATRIKNFLLKFCRINGQVFKENVWWRIMVFLMIFQFSKNPLPPSNFPFPLSRNSWFHVFGSKLDLFWIKKFSPKYKFFLALIFKFPLSFCSQDPLIKFFVPQSPPSCLQKLYQNLVLKLLP